MVTIQCHITSYSYTRNINRKQVMTKIQLLATLLALFIFAMLNFFSKIRVCFNRRIDAAQSIFFSLFQQAHICYIPLQKLALNITPFNFTRISRSLFFYKTGIVFIKIYAGQRVDYEMLNTVLFLLNSMVLSCFY